MVTKVQLTENRIPRLGEDILLLLDGVPWPVTVVAVFQDGPVVTVDTIDALGDMWYPMLVVPGST